MKIVTALPMVPRTPSTPPYVLTIGNFDGVHLGHRTIFDRLKTKASPQSAKTALLTFDNHPSTVLAPNSSVPLLCTKEHKIRLIEQEGIDLLILLPFTESLRHQSAETFLTLVQGSIPFNALILGEDATIGKNKHGNRKAVESLAEKLHFSIEYLPHYFLNDTRISSSIIRQCITRGDLSSASRFLGRSFSIYGTVASGMGRGSQIGFPTANIPVDDLCLPPFGVYAVMLEYDGQKLPGIANLGVAPTLRNDRKPILEVHLFDYASNLYSKQVEVVFSQYIREEKVFAGAVSLKEQIAKDIIIAKRFYATHKPPPTS